MPKTIQPINPLQNGQIVNPFQNKPPQQKPAEKPPERPEPALNDRPERTEARNAPSPRRAEANPAAENPNPQETQNSQGNAQRGNTLDIMA